MTSPKKQSRSAEIRELSLAELQDRAGLGEFSFAEIGRSCWDELCIYVRLMDEFHALRGTGARWREHHDAIDKLHNLAWHAHDIRSFQRFLKAHDDYHSNWRFGVLHPLEQRLKKMLESEKELERIELLQQAKSLLEQADDSYQLLLKSTDVADEMIEDFYSDTSYVLRQKAELERRNADLEKALQLEQQKQHAENPFDLPLGAQNFPLKAIEAAARQNGFRSTRRQLQKHLANWRGADREKGEKWQLERAELEVFLRYLSQKQRAKP